MTTIFTGTLVATGQQGVLSTGKSVWLNSQFVHEMTTTEYVDTAGATQTGTLVLYKAGDGTELLNLIFSNSKIAMQASMNTQPQNGTVPLNIFELEYLASTADTAWSSLYVDTTKIWWLENYTVDGDFLTSETILTLYNNTLDNRFQYYGKEVAATIADAINN